MPTTTTRTVPAIAVNPGTPDSLHHTEIALPDAGPEDVTINVVRVGVCGTDREIIHGDIGYAPRGHDELVIGHEVLGRVAEVGSGVTGVEPGDLVSATVRRPDGCPACQAGQPDMCLWLGYTERGINGAHGFMAQRFIENRLNVVPVPDHLESIAVLTEPLTVVEKAVRQARLIQRRLAYWNLETAVILGAGPIGILGSLLLRSQGIDVYTVARTPKPNPAAQLIEAAGGHYISAADESIFDLRERLAGIDLILESTGSSKVAFDGMQILGNNGVLVLLSLTGGNKTIEVPADAINTSLVVGNKTVVGSVNAGAEDFANAVASLGRFEEQWPGLTGTMITHRLPYTADPAQIAGKADGGIKTVVEFP